MRHRIEAACHPLGVKAGAPVGVREKEWVTDRAEVTGGNGHL